MLAARARLARACTCLDVDVTPGFSSRRRVSMAPLKWSDQRRMIDSAHLTPVRQPAVHCCGQRHSLFCTKPFPVPRMEIRCFYLARSTSRSG